MRRPFSLYGWLPALIVVMTIVAAAICATALYYVERRLLSRAGETLQLSAVEIADKLDRLLYERYGDVQVLAQSLNRIRDRESQTAFLMRMKRFYPVYIWMAVSDDQGTIVAATDPATVGQDISRRPWFHAAAASHGVVVGDIEPFEMGGVDAVAFTAPMRSPEGGFLGIVTTRVALPALEDVVVRTIRTLQGEGRVSSSVEYQFVTQRGEAFIDSDLPHKGGINLRTLGLSSVLKSSDSPSGYVEETHLRRHEPVMTGYARLQGYHDFPGLNWTVLVRMDRDDIVHPVHEVVWKLGTAAVLIWLPMLGLLYWATQRLQTQYRHSVQQERRRDAQYETTRVLSESATFDEAAPKVLEAVCACLDWKVGLLWSVDHDRSELVCRAAWQGSPTRYTEFEKISRARTFERGVGLPGRVWSTGQPAWIVDVVEDPNFPRAPIAAKEGLHAAVAFPILHAGRTWGVLEFYSEEIRSPDRDLVEMMRAIGAQIGQFLDRKHLEHQVLDAQKMNAIGQFAGGVAHDFNNMLTVICGYTTVLIEQLKGSTGAQEALKQIQTAGQRAAGLTKQLLAFSRQQLLQPTVFDMNAVVLGTVDMLRGVLTEDIDVAANLAEQLSPVKADPAQIQQVLVNLALNARDAMPTGGKIRIQTSNVAYSQPVKTVAGDIPSGDYVRLIFSDTGHGMPPEIQARIFEPFFTTKPRGRGTGLGLSTVYGIIQQSGGHISVYSEPGEGTTFTIYLPQARDESASKAPEPAAEALQGGDETILLVEDEHQVRELAGEMLRGRGYTVVEACHGIEALLKAQSCAGGIDLLVTDVVMPQMSGRQLADELKALHPDLRVLYMSGFTDDAVMRYGISSGRAAFLQKPFSEDTLLRAVRTVLDERASASIRR